MMLLEIFSDFIKNITLVALLLTSCLIILNAARDAFEADAPREVPTPIGGTVHVWEWRYMSDFAARGRSDLILVAGLLRSVVILMLVAILTFFAAMGIVDALAYGVVPWWPLQEFVRKSNAQTYLLDILQFGLAWMVLLFAPYIVWKMASIVYDIVRARRDFRKNKIVTHQGAALA